MQQSGGPAESIEPDYQYSRNIAIRKQISTSGYCAGLEIFETDSSSILVVPEDNKFRFWDVTDVDAPIELGVIEDSAQTIARDVEVVAYGDSIRLFLCFVHPYNPNLSKQIPSRLLDVPFTGNIETNIMNDSTYTHSEIVNAGATTLKPASDCSNANALSANATYADSTWKREIAAELLSLDQIKRRDTSAARTNLQNLASNGSSLALKRRALLRLVYLDRCIGHDYATAFARYQTLENSYANTRESVFAKLLLCLHPDSTEWSAFAKETESDSFVGTVHPAIPGWITLSPVWPNPFKDRTTLHVQTEEEQFVDLLIYDISGKVLRREPGYLLRAGKNSLTVERDALSSGLYIIVVQSGAKRVSSLIQVGDW
jgi:hypothetical protein